jgi:hypothetical protein
VSGPWGLLQYPPTANPDVNELGFEGKTDDFLYLWAQGKKSDYRDLF